METRSNVVRVAWIIGLLFFVAVGVWAFFSPRTFFTSIATFPPFNAHLIRDIGAFTIGGGAALIAARFRSDGLFVALAGASVGSVFHVLSHIVDANKGGDPVRDITSLSALAIVLVAGTIARAKEVKP